MISAGIATYLTNGSTALPAELRIAQYASRLYDEFGFNQVLARWSVEAWATALGAWNEPVAVKEERLDATGQRQEVRLSGRDNDLIVTLKESPGHQMIGQPGMRLKRLSLALLPPARETEDQAPARL